MASNYGFFPAAGTDYSHGDEPAIARALGRLGRSLHLHLVGLSGYRTPQHSVAVGGFPNDPHTRGQASDTPGVEGVSESVLNRFGLTRPFAGAKEADHIQLLHGGGTSVSASGPADWLKQAGWPSALIPTMVAIGGAESGWKVNALHTNTDGSIDAGWLQVNSVHGYDQQRLQSDPVYTAKAALAIYKSQGLGAWATYTSGAYKRYMGVSPRVRNFNGSTASGRTRPGGQASGQPEGPDVTSVLSDWADAQSADPTAGGENQFASFNPLMGPLGILPGIPNPLDLFKNLSGSINSVTDFLKVVAWIINPVNILRAVEVLIGLVLMAFGFQAMLQAYGEKREGFVTSENALSRSGLGRVSREVANAVTTAVPEARAAKAAKGAKGAKSATSPKPDTNSRVRKPRSAPHKSRREALRLRYEREETRRAKR